MQVMQASVERVVVIPSVTHITRNVKVIVIKISKLPQHSFIHSWLVACLLFYIYIACWSKETHTEIGNRFNYYLGYVTNL